MIVPSIDLMNGRVVQLVGGRDLALEAGDAEMWGRRFAVTGDIAVVDLDAALGRGSNAPIVRRLCEQGRCRVGGGVRSVAAARAWLDAGAAAVVIGTAARAGWLRELPRDRIVVALDAVDGEVVVDGWRTRTGARIEDWMGELRPFAAAFLVTFVEREGRMTGIDLERVAALRQACGDARLTVAGGITSVEEIAALDRMGIDAQVGMALYTGRLDLAAAFAAPCRSDRPDGLLPTVVADEAGAVLGLAWSSHASLARAIDERRGVYHSRRRGMWVKGESSGATQELLRVDVDCDRDALRFTVRQRGSGFCHTGTRSCFGALDGLHELARTVAARRDGAPPDSYTRRLLDDPSLLGSKLREEAAELAVAVAQEDRGAVVHEAADVLYFTLVALARSGVPLAQVEQELARRGRRVTRRGGAAKEGGEA